MALTETDYRSEWGTNLRCARERWGLSQSQLARIAGLQQPEISRIEAGTRYPTERLKVKLATALEMPVTQLFPYGLLSRQGGAAA